MNRNTRKITRGAMIAAVYVLLTWLCDISGLARVNIRLSEALCILPVFLPEAVPGLFIGCALSNVLNGSVIDVIFGSLATLLAAFLTRQFKGNRFFALLPPVIVNAAVIPFVLKYAYGQPYLFSLITVTAGEIISAGVFGFILYTAIDKNRDSLKF